MEYGPKDKKLSSVVDLGIRTVETLGSNLRECVNTAIFGKSTHRVTLWIFVVSHIQYWGLELLYVANLI
jgi:hypothetical protein